MKQFLLLFLLFIFALPTNAQITEVDLRIDGVGLTTKQETVLRKLGKPSSRKRGGIVPCCGGEELLTLRYPGLEIELFREEDGKIFSVSSMRVTSPKWKVSGINIGANINDAKTKFGQPYHETKEKRSLGLHYNVKDGLGGASFYFRGNKLKEIYWEINFC